MKEIDLGLLIADIKVFIPFVLSFPLLSILGGGERKLSASIFFCL